MGNELSACTCRSKKKRKKRRVSFNEKTDVLSHHPPQLVHSSSRGFSDDSEQDFWQSPSSEYAYRRFANAQTHRPDDTQPLIDDLCSAKNRRPKVFNVPRRRPEPPRLVMWGLYEPSCPSKDWPLRVQQERVEAMQYGKAAWTGSSSFPGYLRRYLRENSKGKQSPREKRRLQDLRTERQTEVPDPRPGHSTGKQNFGFNDHHRKNFTFPHTRNASFQTKSTSIDHNAFELATSRDREMDLPHVMERANSDSFFRSMSSCKSNPDIVSSTSSAFYRSRYAVHDPRLFWNKFSDSIPPRMTEKATQYEEFGRFHPEIHRFPSQYATHDVEESDSYAELQKSLDLLQAAVDEINSYAATLTSTTSPSIPSEDVNDYDKSRVLKVDSEVCEKVPSPTSFAYEYPPACDPKNSIDCNSNVENNLKDSTPLLRDDDNCSEFIEPKESKKLLVVPAINSSLCTGELQAASDGDSLLNCSDLSLLSSSADTVSQKDTSRVRSAGRNVVHYRLRITASPKNINLFKLPATTLSSASKSLLQIAKESFCQLCLLPKKDYTAGYPKRTLLIRAPNRRCIKHCLKEMSVHFPSLVSIR